MARKKPDLSQPLTPGSRLVPAASKMPDSADARLAIVFGDQLVANAPLIRSLTERDTVLMMEVAQESLHVPSHRQRTALFLSAMRHFAADLTQRGVRVRYVHLDDQANTGAFETEILRALHELTPRPTQILCTHPGEWRVLTMLQRVQAACGLPLNIVPDTHFLATRQDFETWAADRQSLTMEFFYREQRRRTGYLMDGTGKAAKPVGGVWNFDKENRLPFGKQGPTPRPPAVPRFEPDDITRGVIDAMNRVLPNLPGKIEPFGWPVTRAHALKALDHFITHRLPLFGPYEDAMWSTEPTLYHSTLSCSLNLKLLNPRECCERAIAAYNTGLAPLQSVEAFVRQIIGWREFIRGVYWLEGPTYAERNSLDQHAPLPAFYWNANTDMACMKACIGQVVDTGFAHHIQRLIVMGNFALISGVHPRAISDWYLGMFVDGVDWVTLPNTLGMVMHADRRANAAKGVTGLVGTKPYAASGNYINRMSNYCKSCRYDPRERSGQNPCPFNIFYWDFLIRTQDRLSDNQRMTMILKNVDRMTPESRTQITIDAAAMRKGMPAATESLWG